MKKLILSTILLLLLSSCAKGPVCIDNTTVVSSTMITKVQPTDSISALVKEWKIYPPNEIKQLPDAEYLEDEYWGWAVPKYRYIYYTVDGSIYKLISDEELRRSPNLLDSKNVVDGVWVGSDEMDLATVIKYYHLARKDVEKALEKIKQFSAKYIINNGLEQDLKSENAEPPNLDILYTFDNEIINAYYRRENPVEPDWSKVKVYDSYAEYLKEKG